MKIVHASFWTAAFASSFMGFALMVPIWLGRKNEDDNSLELHGAFYQFLCQHGKCETSARVLNSDAVPLEVDAWDFDIVSLPVLALLAFLCCFVAVTILEAISCRCCGDRLRTRRVILLITFILIASAFFACLGVFIAIYMCIKFYSDNAIDHAAEFPWSVLLFSIATVLVVIAVLMFIVILLRWSKYKIQYGQYGNIDDDDVIDGRYDVASDRYHAPEGRYTRHGGHTSHSHIPPKSRQNSSRSEADSHVNRGRYQMSSFTNLSDFGGRAKSESGFFHYPAHALGTSTTGSVLMSSGRSLQDSPRLSRRSDPRRNKRRISDLTRSTSYEDILERRSDRHRSTDRGFPYERSRSAEMNRPASRELALPPVPWDSESIDPDMLRDGKTKYRTEMLEEMTEPSEVFYPR